MDEITGERWLPVVGYEGLYEVSDYGRIWSCDRYVFDRRGVRRRVGGRLLAIMSKDQPYDTIGLSSEDHRQVTQRVHWLVATAFLGPRPSAEHEVCHNDGDGHNNHLPNLRWDTRSENGHDKVRHGTHQGTVKTACPRGHALVQPNLREWPLEHARSRQCQSCTLAYKRIYNQNPDKQNITATPEFILLAAKYYVEIMSNQAVA